MKGDELTAEKVCGAVASVALDACSSL